MTHPDGTRSASIVKDGVVTGSITGIAPKAATQPAQQQAKKARKVDLAQEKAAYAKAAKNAYRAECVRYAAEWKGDYYVHQGTLEPHPDEYEVTALTDVDCDAVLTVKALFEGLRQAK